jgi:hypothetical protein
MPTTFTTEPVFVDRLRSPGIDSQPGGPVHENPFCRTGPTGYIGWRLRFLGIGSLAPETFTNTGSGWRIAPALRERLYIWGGQTSGVGVSTTNKKNKKRTKCVITMGFP